MVDQAWKAFVYYQQGDQLMTIRNLNQRSHLFSIIVLPFHETCRRPIFTNARPIGLVMLIGSLHFEIGKDKHNGKRNIKILKILKTENFWKNLQNAKVDPFYSVLPYSVHYFSVCIYWFWSCICLLEQIIEVFTRGLRCSTYEKCSY